jgi:hypothetical protein
MPIGSPEDAASVARLLRDGKITGAGREAALSDLRAFHEQAATPPADAPTTEPDSKLKQWGKTVVGSATGAVADVAGMIPQALHSAADIGRLGLASSRAALPGNSFADTPDWLIPSGATTWKPPTAAEQAGTIGQIKGGLQGLGVPVGPADPNDPAQRYVGAGLEGIGAGLLTGGTGVGPAMAGAGLGIAGQAVHDTLKDKPRDEELAQLALMFGPLAGGKGARDWARSKLQAALQRSPANVKADVTSGTRFMGPDSFTAAQTADSGFIQSLSKQTAGTPAVRAANIQVDRLANKLTAEARALAPIPLTNPGMSGSAVADITTAMRARDTQLQQAAEHGYTSGLAHVSALTRANPDPVQFPALTSAAERILNEQGDIWNTAPKELEPRVRTLLGYLLPKKPHIVAGQPTPPRGPITTANASDAMKLGKALNQTYSGKERGALTQNMDEVFAELKSAYKTDLESAPSNPAIDKLREVNSDYAAAQGRVKELQDSVANSVLKSLGTTNPDSALRKLLTMPPHAQRYLRDVLLTHDPDSLHALQGHYIDLHLGDAKATGGGSMASRTNPGALEPKQLAESGIFDPVTIQKLQDAQGAVNTIRNFFPQIGGDKNAPGMLETARIGAGTAAGQFSPVFAGGGLIRNAMGGWLQKLLVTPEGRASLLRGAEDPQLASKLLRNLALYNNALTTPQPTQ